MHLFRVVVSWSGNAVKGTACNVLHFDGSNQSAPPVAAILNSYSQLGQMLTNQVTITVPATGDIIEDTTGALVGVWSAAGSGTFTGTGVGNCAAGVGVCVGWSTGGIVNGVKGPRKLRGRTFIAPVNVAAFDTDGTLTAGALTVFQGFADALRGTGPLSVWHRPTTTGGSDGNSYGVLAGRVKDKAAYLSSRRD